MDTIRWRGIEISKPRGLAISVYRSIKDDNTGVFGLHFEIPFLINIFVPVYHGGGGKYDFNAEMWASWGIGWHDSDTIHLNWGEKCKVLWMPWGWEWYRTSYLMPDKTWEHETRKNRNFDYFNKLEKWKEVYPFKYIRRNRENEIQERQATVTVSEMEFRLRGAAWCSLFKLIRKSIWIEFDGEVGERSGSWKGGTIGCGNDLLPGETPEQCLRRLEAKWNQEGHR